MGDAAHENRDVTLDVIGREHQALMAAGQQAHFALVAELVLSLLTLAFCVGWVTISSQLSFGGLTISAPQPYLLLVLAAIVTGLSWHVATLGLYGERVRKNIATRYDALGLTDHTDSARFTAFMYPDLITVLGVLPAKLAAYLKHILQQRPIKRGPLPLLIVLCWLVTLVTSFVLLLVILLGPLVLDGYVGVFALQHHMNPVVVVAIVVGLFLVNIAGSWTSMQTVERKDLISPALRGVVDDIVQYGKYVSAQKAAQDAEAARDKQGPESGSGVPDADTRTSS